MKLEPTIVSGRFSRRAFSGVTVLELVVVLAILIATSGLLIYNVAPDTLRFGGAGGNRTTAELVTFSTMQELRKSIVGDGVRQGYWDDMGQTVRLFPAMGQFGFLFQPPPTSLLDNPNLATYDPHLKRGWHGPYFLSSGGYFPLEVDERNFTSDYLPHDGIGTGTTYPVLLDGWGNPLVIQGPFSGLSWSLDQIKKTRIVSAGPNRILNTSTATASYDDPIDPTVNDDIILYIFK